MGAAEAAGAVFLQIGRCEVQGLGELLVINRKVDILESALRHPRIMSAAR